MKLNKIKLKNFQGLATYELILNGKNASIYGDNACGKTTLFNAYTWVLFDKASTGEKGYSPKPLDEHGNERHHLTTSADMEVTLENGNEVTLRKELVEVWQKKRGSLTETFTGNTINYYVNGVPKSKSEFEKFIATLFVAETVPVLTSPHYFSQMKWQDRRKLLLDAVGNISDEEIIASNVELADLPALMTNHSMEDFQKILTASRKAINAELNSLTARIDEVTRSMPDGFADMAPIEAEIFQKKAEIAKLDAGKQNSSRGEKLRQLSDEIQLLKERWHKQHDSYTQSELDRQATEHQKMQAIAAEADELRSEAAMLSADIHGTELALANTIRNRKELTEKYKLLLSQKWTGSEKCPVCGQNLPDCQLEEQKAKFDTAIKEQIEVIRKQVESDCSKKIIAASEEAIKDMIKSRDDINMKFTAKAEQIKNFSIVPITPFEMTAESESIRTQLASITKEYDECQQEWMKETSICNDVIQKLRQAVYELEERKAEQVTAEQQKRRADELRARQKELAAEYDKVERSIYLCELFQRTKVTLLDDVINRHFKTVQFRMLEQNISGGVTECCTVLVPNANGELVDYGFANSAAKINAGLEIIDKLVSHLGYSLPIFVDNAESVTHLTSVTPQVIRLVVSESDKNLRVEVGE